MGPCESLHAVAYGLLWADSVSLAMAEGLHHRPMREFRSATIPLAEIYAGPRENLVWKSIAYLSWPIRTNCSGFMVSEIGPCEDLHAV
jgi:hypothetical protein